MLYTAKIGIRRLITITADSEDEAKDKLRVMLKIRRLRGIYEQWQAAGKQLTKES
jgi:hypothetical protein